MTATAFWSYAHSDDEGSGGQIRRLKEQVDHAFKRHSGELLRSFFDRHGPHRLEWGDEWRSKISTTISGTTFFIAVISPSYLKSASCQDEFMQFWERGKDSELKNLLLPILWVKVYPETEIEQQIWAIAQERQYISWTSTRRLDENSIEYKNLIDEMGERLADTARTVADVPEEIEPEVGVEPATGVGGDVELKPLEQGEPPGLIDLHAEAMERAQSFSDYLQEAINTLQSMQNEISVLPLHPQASAGQRLFYFKRLAKEMTPYAEQFERKAKQSEEQARLLNKVIFGIVDLLADPKLRGQTDFNENVGRFRELPATVEEKFGDLDRLRDQITQIGRMSRDLRVPLSAIERGFDSLDAIKQLIADWAAAFDGLTNDGPSSD